MVHVDAGAVVKIKPRVRGEPIRVKRLIDVVVGVCLAVLTLPVVLVTAVIVAVALRSWPFFVQERIGRGGRPFSFVKLRTLPTSTPRYAAKYDVQTLRTPAVCRWLRSFHLDELPQLWLVFTGRMSLVGPRPEMAFLHARLDPDFARSRTAVRPGCTGLWQISVRCQNLILEHPEYDEYYLANRSVSLDLWILSRTALLLLPGREGRLLTDSELPGWSNTGHVAAQAAPESPLQPAET